MSDDEIDKAVKEAAEFEAHRTRREKKPSMQETKLRALYSRQRML